MRTVIRRVLLSYLKSPFFWAAVAIVIGGTYQTLQPYLTIHYMTAQEDEGIHSLKSEEEAASSDSAESAQVSEEKEIFNGYIPAGAKKHRSLWEAEVRNCLQSVFGMSKEKAEEVIREMQGMKIRDACKYLEVQYGYYGAYYTWEDTSLYKGSAKEVNSYIRQRLEKHPFSWYFARKFADFAGLHMGFAATVLLAALYLQDMRKHNYELLHTKPIRASEYVIGKTVGGFLVLLIVLGILNLIFWILCRNCAVGNGFGASEVSLADFLLATAAYILPDMLMIVCVYTFIALLLRSPLPAAPLLVLYMIYSNMGRRNAEGVYGYYGQPLAIMVRFPGNFFEVSAPPLVLQNQIFLLAASGVLVFLGIQLWRRRRI